MSCTAKYSPVDPESAFARCDAKFDLFTVVKFENEWSGAVDGKQNVDVVEKSFRGGAVREEEEKKS